MMRLIYSAVFTVLFLAGTGFAVLFFLANFSSTKTKYSCYGTFSQGGNKSSSETIYFRLEQYRWWVGLWSDSDGNLWLEIPGRTVDTFPKLTEAENFIQIFEYDDTFAGQLSTLSGAFSINTHNGVFDGQCRATPNA